MTPQILKILRDPQEEFAPLSAYLESFNYVLMMKKRGVNIRATSNSYGHYPSQAWQDATDLWTEAGILTVCSVGNNALNGDSAISFYPAQYNSVGVVSVDSDPRFSVVLSFL